jgi:hypothetical protein
MVTELRIMLSNYKREAATYPLDVMGLDSNAHYKYTLHLLDEQHDFEKIDEQTNLSRSVRLLANNTVMIIISGEK